MAANDVLGISGQMDITDIQKSFDALIENLNKLGIKTDDVSARMTKAMNNISRGVASNSTQSAESIRQLQSDIAGINNILSNTAKFASAAFAGFSVKEVVSTIANVRGEFQQLEIAFGTMLGSEEKATVLMKQLTDLAATTPFDMKGVASGAKSLLAYGFSAVEVTDTMRRLGDVCAGLGLNLQDLAWLYGTTRTQGRLFTQDFRQFTGRGIPLAEELAKQFGVTKDKVQDLVTAGKVGFPEVQKAIESMTNEGGKFGGLMEKQSHSITGQISNIEDTIEMAINDIGQQTEGVMNTSLDIVSTAIDHWKEIGEAIMTAAGAIGLYKAAAVAVATWDSNVANVGYDAEIKQLSNVFPETSPESKNKDLDEAVSTGALTEQKAALVAQLREEAAARVEILEAQAKEAVLNDANAQENLNLAKQTLDAKSQEYDKAVEVAAAAQQDVQIKKEQYEYAKKIAEQAQEEFDWQQELLNSGAGSEAAYDDASKTLAAAQTQELATAEAYETAVKEANTAAEAVNTAETNLNTASDEVNAAVKAKQATATAADTANKEANTAAQNLNTASTARDSAAKGIWASVTTLCKQVQDAWNASMLASPLFWIAAVIAGVTYAVYKLATAESAHDAALRQSNEEWSEFDKKIAERQSNIENLIRTIQSETSSEYQKAEAYQKLSELAPQLTEKYDQAAIASLDFSKAQTEIAENMDKAKFDEAVANVEKYKQEIEKLNQSADADAKRGGGNSLFYTFQIAQAKENLKQAEAVLNNINELQKQAVENAKPIEVKLKEANENEQVRQEIFDFYDKAMLLASDWQSANDQVNFVTGETRLDRFISDTEDKIEELKKEIEKNPANVNLQLKQTEYQKILDGLVKMKSDWNATGATSIPLTFRTNWQSAEQALADAKAKAQAAAMKGKTYQQAYNDAKSDYNAKKAKVDKIKKNKSAYTADEYSTAVSQLEDSEKAFKALGGDVSKNKNKNTTGDRERNKANTITNAKDRLQETEQKNTQAREKEAKELERDLADARIEAKQEGAEKVLAQRKRELEKEIEQIESEKSAAVRAEKERQKAEFDARQAVVKAKGGRVTKWDESKDIDSSRITSIEDKYEELRKYKVAEYNRNQLREQQEQLNEFLKEYGTYKEKELIIEEEYDKKIRKAQDSGNVYEAMQLRAQKQKDVGQNKASALESQIDYTTVFGQFGIILREQMAVTLSTMKEYAKTPEFKSKDVTQQKNFLEKMSQIERQYGTSEWKDHSFVKLGSLIDKYNVALTKRNAAEQKLNESTKELIRAQENYNAATENGTEAQKSKAKENLDNAVINNEVDRDNLQKADANLVDAQNNVTDAATRLHETLTSVDNLLGSMKSGSLSSVWSAFTDFDKKVNGGKVTEAVTKSVGKLLGKAFEGKSDLVSLILGAILNLLDVIKEQGIGGIVGGLIESILGAINGLIDNILSGEFIEQIVGAIVDGIGEILDNVIGRIGNVLSFGALSHKGPSSWFTNSNEDEVADRRDELVDAAADLRKSIDSLKEELAKQSGAKAIQTAQELYDKQQQLIENARQQLINENDYHSAHHSNSSYWNNVKWGDDESSIWYRFFTGSKGSWKSINETLAAYKSLNPDAKTETDTANSYEDLLKLTPEQLDYIRSHNIDQWNAILDVGKYDASDEKWEALADLAGTLDDTIDTLNESLTNISFDSMKDEFISTLTDMDATADDFADKFSQYLMQAVLNAQISNLMDEEMETFYKEWANRAKANNGNLTKDDIDYLSSEWDKLVAEGLAIRDQVADITGYADSQSRQNATTAAIEAITADQASSLIGIGYAMQVALEQGNEVKTAISVDVSSMRAYTEQISNNLTEMRDIQYEGLGQLQQIAKNTAPISLIRDDISSMYKLMKERY